MLEEDDRAAGGAAGRALVQPPAGDAVQGQQIPVLRAHHVTLRRVAVGGHQLGLQQQQLTVPTEEMQPSKLGLRLLDAQRTGQNRYRS